MIPLKLLGFIFWVRCLVWRWWFFEFFSSCPMCWQTSSRELFCPSSASSWAHLWVCFSTSVFCTILLKGSIVLNLWRFQLLKVLCLPWKMETNYLGPWATWDSDGNYMISSEYFWDNWPFSCVEASNPWTYGFHPFVMILGLFHENLIIFSIQTLYYIYTELFYFL